MVAKAWDDSEVRELLAAVDWGTVKARSVYPTLHLIARRLALPSEDHAAYSRAVGAVFRVVGNAIHCAPGSQYLSRAIMARHADGTLGGLLLRYQRRLDSETP